MPIVYQATISPAGKEKLFHITWYNEQTRGKNSSKQSAAEITAEEIERLCQKLFFIAPTFAPGSLHFPVG
jgi:hypothetical protein